jgi:biotin transport system substrate-specific component
MKNHVSMLVLAGLFAALTAVGAFLHIPVGLVSVTLHFLFTALAGILLGPKWGAVSQLVYVALGLIGLPVFTMGGGPGYLLQPSAGFLLALIPSAWLIGFLCHGRPLTVPRICAACVAGDAVLYLIGLPYMALILNVYLDRQLPLSTLLWTGMAVYLPGDALKIAAAAVLAPPLSRRLAGLSR